MARLPNPQNLRPPKHLTSGYCSEPGLEETDEFGRLFTEVEPKPYPESLIETETRGRLRSSAR
jgi:hypothetical protein